jgi:hypothetical protein
LVLNVAERVRSEAVASTLVKLNVSYCSIVEGRVTVGVSILSIISSVLFVLNSRKVVFLCRSFLIPTCWLRRVLVIVRLALGCATVPSNSSTSYGGGSETCSFSAVTTWSCFLVITTESFSFSSRRRVRFTIEGSTT